MSGKSEGGGYTPAKMTSDEFQKLGLFFKDLLAENPMLKAAIISAGVGGVFDSLHVLWLALKYLLGR